MVETTRTETTMVDNTVIKKMIASNAHSESPVVNASFDNQVADNNLMQNMKSAACGASQLLKSLSHPDRLMLLCQLTQGEYCVSDLEKMVGLGQPSLSQQLGILRKENLVNTRREGKQIYYSIASEDALALLQLLYERFCPKPELEPKND